MTVYLFNKNHLFFKINRQKKVQTLLKGLFWTSIY